MSAGPGPRLPDVPRLETERLILRGHLLSDLEPLYRMWADPRVLRYLGVTSQTRQDCNSRLLRYIGHWAAHGWGYWAVIDKASGAYAGDVGLGLHKRDITPSIDHMPEIGWVLSPDQEGRGIATEAARAALEWFDAAQPGSTTCCIFHPDNAASIRVAEKLGYRFWTMGSYHGDTPIYVR